MSPEASRNSPPIAPMTTHLTPAGLGAPAHSCILSTFISSFGFTPGFTAMCTVNDSPLGLMIRWVCHTEPSS